MEVSISNWHEARAAVAQIRGMCEAVDRGDRPETIADLTLQNYLDLYLLAVTVVKFCQASLSKSGLEVAPVTHNRAYMQARQCGKILGKALLLREDLPIEERAKINAWLAEESAMRNIRFEYS